MPTIDELVAAPAAADGDYLPISQAGIMHRVTRAQILAGTQQALSLGQGSLLGRNSAGTGAPEAVVVGAHLQLQNGVLAGAAPFTVAGLPAVASVSPTDMVAVAQGGRDVGVPAGVLLAEIANVPGLDLSNQVVRIDGGSARSLGAWMTDAMPVEAFGAVGDGVTDDSAAIDRAVSSGRPVYFGPKTYVLNGQWTVTRAVVLLGVPGMTVLRRVAQAGGAWISVGGPSFVAIGIIFDAGGLSGESWGVLVGSVCTQSLFERCVFRGATGATLGCGLTIGARTEISGAPSQHVVRGCEAYGNACHGIWVQAVTGATVVQCQAHGNGQYGICLDFNDPAFQQQIRHCQVTACHAWGNRRGISVGNYNETNLQPPRWGLGHPDAIGVLVSGNRCHDNTDWGIAVSGASLQVSGNLVESNGSGILSNSAQSIVSDNMVIGPGQFGIDGGGSSECEIRDNLVQGFAVGINPGGSTTLCVAGNDLSGNAWGITAYGMETDGQGTPFGIACSGLTIEGNRIQLRDGQGGGVFLVDAPQNVVVAGNRFFGGAACSPSQALWAHTDTVGVRGNLWNNQSRMICNPVAANGLQQVQFPDMLDAIMLTAAGQGVSSLVGQHQAAMAGQVAFIKVTAGGSGYTHATVTMAGSGTGAAAAAYVRDGSVIAVAVQAGGAGYGAADLVVTIQGDGQGAAAAGTVGLPVPEERALRVHCNGPVKFQRVGSLPFQDNWTGTDISVPQASVVEWIGTWGGWQATSFPLGDYLVPAGDGSVALRSAVGDVVVRPAGTGHFRVSGDTEPIGFASLLGRGIPEGVIAAPAGSDYRNLDGGTGTTLWVKRSGTGATGWVGVA